MAETVGSSFCAGFGVCQLSNMQIILMLQVSLFFKRNGGTHVFDLLAQRPLLSETGVSLYTMDVCTFHGF